MLGRRLRPRGRAALVGAALVLAVVGTGCDPFTPPQGPAPLRYRDDVATSVTTTRDITYGTAVDHTGQTVELKLDMYQPAGDQVRSRPAIVWIHGGNFCCGNRTSPEIVDEATYFARKGYVTVSIDYRLVAGGCAGGSEDGCLTAIRQAREDGQTAVRFLRRYADRYGIDPTRIAVGGTSAGAITALNVGYSPENPGPGDHQGQSSAVRAVQSLSGAELASGPIDDGDSPALLFHGTNDTLVSYAWAQDTATRAQEAGLVAVLRTWEGEGHVPYTQHRTQILEETRNFFYWHLNLARAAQ